MVSSQGMLHVKLVQRAYELSDAVGATCREDHLPEITALVETLAGAARLSCSIIMICRRRCSAGVQTRRSRERQPSCWGIVGGCPVTTRYECLLCWPAAVLQRPLATEVSDDVALVARLVLEVG